MMGSKYISLLSAAGRSVGAALVLVVSFASCGKMVFEDRTECPAILYLKAVNAWDIPQENDVYMEALTPDRSEVLASVTTGIGSFIDGTAAIQVGTSQNVIVCGATGADRNTVRSDTQWMAVTGGNWPALWRFSASVPAFVDTNVENIRFKKEYMEVTVILVNGWFEEDLPEHDYEVVVTSSTSGIDIHTGLPVKGDYSYRPRMKDARFVFRVPRQADRSLQMVIRPYDANGRRYDDKATRLVFWSALQHVPGFSWEVDDLPDMEIEYDCINRSVMTYMKWIY